MTALKCFVPLSRTCSSFAADIIHESINSSLLPRTRCLLSHRIIRKIEIGKNSIGTIQLKRALSTDAETNMSTVDYAYIKDLPNHPDKTLIDVREPNELKETGIIPTSVNIPRKWESAGLSNIQYFKNQYSSSSAVGTVPDALNLTDESFKGKYGRDKPTQTSEIIFSCKLGMRAGKAAVAAAGLGYGK